MAGRPRRPPAENPAALGFTRQPMVRWLSPGELVRTAKQVVLSGIFGTFSDKREIQAALAASQVHDFSRRDEIWIDYVADLGDGFDSTFTVASCLASPTLDLAAPAGGGDGSSSGDVVGPGGVQHTKRGSILVMGGDQVYPSASVREYENRLVGPYRAALPYTEADHPALFAIPGNHDWYDGLTAFLRVFCQQSWVGGWTTRQQRSYFAIELPARWWLWGIDVQFDTYIDAPQLAFFRDVELAEGDNVIVCSAKPTWVEANHDNPEAFVTLDYFERKVVRDRGARVRLSLAGDAHHYAHYVGADNDEHRITAGGGGAYLSGTHQLPELLVLPPAASKDPGKTTSVARYERTACYPTAARSRRLRFGVWRLPVKNPSFWALVGAVHLLYAGIIYSANRRPGAGFGQTLSELSFLSTLSGTVGSPLGLVVTAIIGSGLAGFTKAPDATRKWPVGLSHTGAHLFVIAAVVFASSRALSSLDGAALMVGFAVGVGVVGGLLGSWVMALYLAVADALFGFNTNELFAAQRIEDAKNFLRIRVGADGVVRVYPVAVDRVGRDWRLRSSPAPTDDEPWFVAGRPPTPARLIEGPITLTGRRPR